MRRPLADAGPRLSPEASQVMSGRVRDLRATAGVRQADLAAELGLGQPMLSRLEKGHAPWRQGDAEKALLFLARCLEAKAAQAEGGEAA